MEKDVTATINLSDYTKQLDEITYHLTNLKYQKAITKGFQLMDQLTDRLDHAPEKAQFALNGLLSAVCKLLQTSYFNWLVRDPSQFCHNQKAKKDLLKHLKQFTTITCFSEFEKQHSQFLVCVIELLFHPSMERCDLQNFRLMFCDFYEQFVQKNQKFNQALVLLGLALIAAYEGDLSSTYQGLNHAVNTYPFIRHLIKTIEYQLPRTMSLFNEEYTSLTNPLAKYRFTEIASSLRLRP